VINDKKLAWECLITHNVDQHGAFFHGTNTSRDGNEHQADGNYNHETCRREEVIIHKDAEVIENR
jgi:hypothetical protein